MVFTGNQNLNIANFLILPIRKKIFSLLVNKINFSYWYLG